MPTKALRIIPLVTAGLLLAARPALADEWIGAGQLNFGASYSDNPTLQPDESSPKSARGTISSARAEFERQIDNRSYSISPRVTRNWYPNRDLKDAEHTNLYLDSSAAVNYKRLSWNISLNATDQGILTSEQDDSANFLNVDDTRQQFSASPSVAWEITKKDQISFAASFSDVDFEREFNSRFDYQASGITLFYTRTIDERQSIGVTALANNYQSETLRCPIPLVMGSCPLDPSVFENDTDGKSYSVNYGYRLSQTARLKLNVGSQSSDLTSSSSLLSTGMELFRSDSTFDSTQYSLSVTNTSQEGDWEFGASRSVQPSSTGTPTEKWRFFGGYTRRITPSLTWSANFQYRRQKATEQELAEIRGETKLIRVDMTLSWKVAERASLVWSYSFRQRDPKTSEFDSDTTNQATANNLGFGARYRFGI